MATLTNFHRFNNTGPVAVAKEANAIRRGVSTVFSNRGDRVARQTAFLRDVAREAPDMARHVVQRLRKSPDVYAKIADVPESIIGLYARVMEEQLAVQA